MRRRIRHCLGLLARVNHFDDGRCPKPLWRVIHPALERCESEDWLFETEAFIERVPISKRDRDED